MQMQSHTPDDIESPELKELLKQIEGDTLLSEFAEFHGISLGELKDVIREYKRHGLLPG